MNKKRLLIILILSIFLIGMIAGTGAASHTFKKGKYHVTVSDKTYNKIKKGDKVLVKKVGVKKVTKWTTKKIKTYESWINKDGEIYKTKYWSAYSQISYKSKFIKSVTKYYSDGDITWDYYKVPKTVKKPVYLVAYGYGVGFSPDKVKYTGKVIVELQNTKWVAF